MFDNIAHRYDFINTLLSFGIHKSWRRKAVKKLLKFHPKTVLDVATGTGDFAIVSLKKLNPEKIVGVDISEGMLACGREKLKKAGLEKKIKLQYGDSENLPFADNTFDAITVGFGVRNFESLEKGLACMLRVLKPGGTLVILEFSRPSKFPAKQFYNFHFYKLTPAIGGMISKDKKAYRYLPESVKVFPDGKAFTDILEKTGFVNTTRQPLAFGIASIYTGMKEQVKQ